MAHVVPRREPCIKCNNPVFFAERLVIEDHLYHRTCFRCARCDSVLTLGNFYQTEKDNEFCCETCPDEEIKSKRTSKVDESNRLSIAQRIALFEKSETTSVLKKSLSDEEKSKSLNRQQLPSSTNSQALNSFLTSQINSEQKSDAAETDDEDEKTIESLSTDSESEDENHRKSEATSISDQKVVEDSSVHNNSISSDNNVNSTKEPTEHDNAMAQTTNAQQQFESHNKLIIIKDTSSVGDVVLDTNDDVQDDIELEFEKLAEEAINNPVTITSQPKIIALTTQPEKPQIAVEINIEQKSEIVSDENKENQIEDDVKVVEVLKEEVKVEEVLKKEEEPEITTIETKVDTSNEYPDDLNPFGDDEEEEEVKESTKNENKGKKPSLNPFGSCSEDEEEGQHSKLQSNLQKPPRPPPPRASITSKPVSTNPFGSDDDEVEEAAQKHSIGVKTPVPTPRKQL